MSASDDTVRLVVEGKEFIGWTSAEIKMSISELADTFTLTGPFDPTDETLKAAIEPYKDITVSVYLGDDLYLTGKLDVPDFHAGADSREVTLSGRSLPGILVDCSAECDMTTQMTGLTYHQIAAKVAAKLGVKVRDDDSEQSSRLIPEARATFGQTAFDFLHKLAAPHNLLLNCGYDGRMVITNADDLIGYELRAHLEEGDPIFGPDGVRSTFDRSKRYTHYRIATSFCDVADITGEVIDTAFREIDAKTKVAKVYRPLTKATEYYVTGDDGTDTTSGTAADPAKTAARLMSESIASSMGITANLVGWRRPDGGRWSERQNITVKYPSAYLYKAARYVISTLSLKLSPDSGYTASLGLVPPEVYSSTLIKAKKQKVADLW